MTRRKRPSPAAALPERDKPWLIRTYSGHSTAAKSNELYRKNLSKGQTGLSIAFDLPTQTGYDADHELARGEVGKVGVPVSHLGDMRTLLADIPLGQMNTSMTINATAAWLLALYVATADGQGTPRTALTGTIQNDIIKEYLSRGTYVFPPAPSLRLIKDTIIFTCSAMPKWNPTNVCSYHLQEAGATPVQELAFALATAQAVLDAVKASGEVAPADFGAVVGRISFFVNAGLRFITEICKMRAFTELWDEITARRYGVEDAKHRLFRYGVQVNSLGLTEPQAENNVYRILIEMLAVTLSRDARARAVQLPAWNEALGLPRPWDQQWSIRMQQILAYETDLLEYADVFEGSKVVRRKVDELKAAAKAELERIDAMGGAVAAIDYMKHALVESNTERVRSIESGEQVVVGVNRWTETEVSPLPAGEGSIEAVDPAIEKEQVERLSLARGARRQGGEGRHRRAGARGARRSQRHGAVHRLRQGGRDHRRVGRDAARGVRRIPGADGHLGRRGCVHRRRPRGRARRGGARLGPARAAHQAPRRQARPRRPFQRCRADRGAGARLRHGGGLRGHPAHAGADRARGGEEAVHVVGLSILSGSHVPLVGEVMSRMRKEGLDDVPVVVGGIIPPEDAATLKAPRRRRRLHAEELPAQRHHARHRRPGGRPPRSGVILDRHFVGSVTLTRCCCEFRAHGLTRLPPARCPWVWRQAGRRTPGPRSSRPCSPSHRPWRRARVRLSRMALRSSMACGRRPSAAGRPAPAPGPCARRAWR